MLALRAPKLPSQIPYASIEWRVKSESGGHALPLSGLGKGLCRSSTGHFAAFLRAPSAGCGALLAVIGFVLFTLFTACVTNFGTQPTDVSRKLGTPAHKCRREPAKLSAIAIDANAFRHRLDVLFTEARIGTILTGLSASQTCGNTLWILLTVHIALL